MLRLLISGSKDLNLRTDTIRDLCNTFNLMQIGEIISSDNWGIDKCGEAFASKYNIQYTRFESDRKKHGTKAILIRNQSIAVYADLALIIHNGSTESVNLINAFKNLNKQVYEVILKSNVDEA